MKILSDIKKHILDVDLSPILTKNSETQTIYFRLPKSTRNINEWMEMKRFQENERTLIRE